MTALLTLLGTAASLHLQAETISTENVSLSSLRNILSERYGTKIDGQSLTINSDGSRFNLRIVDIDNKKLIYLYAFYNKYEKRSVSEHIVLANQWNDKKRLLRASIDPQDGSSTCDYYIVCDSGIESRNLLKSLEWFITLCGSWRNFVVNGGNE